jgi:hypothetical protein
MEAVYGATYFSGEEVSVAAQEGSVVCREPNVNDIAGWGGVACRVRMAGDAL